MLKTIKGTRDILPPEIARWQMIETAARDIFHTYQYGEIRTPVFEETALFARSIGGETDIVQKEMYSFVDKGDNQLTLRPEGTAPVVRAFIEHNLYADQALRKLYYIGPMFRYERPQKGRYRQFHQIGAEALGSDHPAIEAEVIEMLDLLLRRLGIMPTTLFINSIGDSNCRPAYVEQLRKAIEHVADQLCADCRHRAKSNPLRVLDCKVESCQPIISTLPVMIDHLCDGCAEHFARFRRYLDVKGIAYRLNLRLVRGLDYYVRTTFEVTSDRLGSQNALLGGGRYDGLSETLDGPPIQGFGFAMGMERMVLALPESDAATLPVAVYIAWMGPAALDPALDLARRLRGRGISVAVDFEPRSLKSQMREANKLRSQFVVLLGDEEVKSGKVTVKTMADGVQQTFDGDELDRFFSMAAPRA